MADTAQHAQGKLISFEGGEGGGKTTQVAILTDRLKGLGYEVVSLREPGGTGMSEQIRAITLSTDNNSMSDRAEVLLFQAARAQIYQEVVLPALQKPNTIVLMDRTRDSSVVYQGIARGFGVKLIEELNNFSTNNTYPSLTLLLDVQTQIGLGRRRATGEVNRLDSQTEEFHQQTNRAYRELAAADTTGRWRVIDANQPVEQVSEAIWKIITGVVGI